MDELNEQHMQAFADDGYVLLKHVVPERLLAAVDAEIDAFVEAEGIASDADFAGRAVPPSQLPAADAALRQSGALRLASQLVAPHPLIHAFDHIQVALNRPGWSHIPGGPHLDCMVGPEPGSFTMLAAIYLCDESRPASGNLWVWPGSHRDHQRLFQERGVDVLLQTQGHATLLDPPLELGPAELVLAERGDLLLAHFMLGHNRGGNETERWRRIIYFRLACEGHRARSRETLLDPFTEYEPLRHLRRR